jgi:hypothetical protein
VRNPLPIQRPLAAVLAHREHRHAVLRERQSCVGERTCGQRGRMRFAP